MANKILEATKLSIEVKVDTDEDGNPVYSKKNIGNLAPNADVAKVAAVVTLIEGVLAKQTRYFYLTELSKVENN